MDEHLAALFARQGGVATAAQILTLISKRQLQQLCKCFVLEQIWRGVYGAGPADEMRKLRGLDLACGTTVPVCMGTAAAAYGFDTEPTSGLHVLNPPGHQLRPAEGLVVHRRDGAPLLDVSGRPSTAPAWTAIEVARSLARPRALATLDAALRSGHCDRTEMARALSAQAGRRGVVAVRDLLHLADGRAESPMESEARLVMVDGGLPSPVLQYELANGWGRLLRLDFAWPHYKVAAEYDSYEWHSGADALRRDRDRFAVIHELGWVVIVILAEDVRRRPAELVRRIGAHLGRAHAG